jgi:hypothetical protein
MEWKGGKATTRVEMKAVVVPPPRRAHLVLALQEEVGHPGPLQARGDGETGRAGADDDCVGVDRFSPAVVRALSALEGHHEDVPGRKRCSPPLSPLVEFMAWKMKADRTYV